MDHRLFSCEVLDQRLFSCEVLDPCLFSCSVRGCLVALWRAADGDVWLSEAAPTSCFAPSGGVARVRLGAWPASTVCHLTYKARSRDLSVKPTNDAGSRVVPAASPHRAGWGVTVSALCYCWPTERLHRSSTVTVPPVETGLAIVAHRTRPRATTPGDGSGVRATDPEMADVFSVQLRTYVRRYVRARSKKQFNVFGGRTCGITAGMQWRAPGENVFSRTEQRSRTRDAQMFLVFLIWAGSGPDVPSVPHLGRVRPVSTLCPPTHHDCSCPSTS
ncbi:unnamed protein product [Gadus morhua 'NCC']